MSNDSAPLRMLRPDQIIETITRLEQRIAERFPISGLRRVAQELLQISREAVARGEAIRRPHIPLRLAVLLLSGLLLVALGAAFLQMRLDREHVEHLFSPEEFVQTFEAAIASVVFVGAAIAFLLSLELRYKRQRALAAVRELRALAHIVDMHQLTKDPESIVLQGPSTPSSPKRTLTPFELSRYLDYCSELLSLISKVAATYVQDFPDAAALESVDQLTGLTNDLSRNIWQKMNILDRAVQELRNEESQGRAHAPLAVAPVASQSAEAPAGPSSAPAKID